MSFSVPGSSQIPPPEPESVRNSSWTTRSVAGKAGSSKSFTGHNFPDLPTMSQSEVIAIIFNYILQFHFNEQ